jgi:hypothetical protein
VANNVLTDTLSEPLNGATTAKVEINCGTGNLMIDTLRGGEPVLARGTLEYFEKQGLPTRSVRSDNDQAILALNAGRGRTRQSWFRLPWAACGGAYAWQIHLNPAVASDIAAHSDGGNVTLNLADMVVTRLAADTGGGNLDVVLPDSAANLSAMARTGAGNVTVAIGRGTKGSTTVNATSGAGNVVVHVPSGLAARVHATSGLGKVTVDPRLGQLDRTTYQSPDYDGAVDTVELTVHSGAGNVHVTTTQSPGSTRV